jgi:hypothetical protein
MKITVPQKIILTLAVSAFAAASALGAPTMGAAQQHIHDAADSLHKAQSSANPVEDLQNARHSLEEARHNKQGNRADAIASIDKAIAELKVGNRIDADKDITAALKEIEDAAAAGHKNKVKGQK